MNSGPRPTARVPPLGAFSLIFLLVLVSFAALVVVLPPQGRWVPGTFALGSGITATALMGAAAVLSARWRWVESAFGGLDRVYAVHKWLGVWALVFASVHLVFKSGDPSWEVAPIVQLPGSAARMVRQLSFVALMVIVLLALNRAIPYRVWRWWHKLSGPLFLVVVAHWLSFRSPIPLASPAGIWLALVSVMGVAGAAYKLLLYPALSQHAEYRVATVSTTRTSTYLELVPVARTIPFVAGQFAFVSFKREGLREPHPYTIASAGGADGRIAFMVRASGDYTANLVKEAEPGLLADVYAPFGRFERRPDGNPEVWIAGGVGITPFIAWLEDPGATGLERVTLFNFTTPGRELPSAVDLPALAARRGVQLVEVTTGPSTPSFREHFARLVGQAGADHLRVAACGPKGLLAEVRELMRQTGVPTSALRHEVFEFR